jgi:Holliday junction DNA helicase RuvA
MESPGEGSVMIARLRGTLHEKTPERIIVDVQGVGYDLRVPLSTYGSLPAVGEEVKLLVHTHVREDAISLFGFQTRGERYLFEKMIGVSGVGPRLAIALLSGVPPAELVESIRQGNVAALCRVPGVGRKTAERLVVDLRDKMEGEGGEPGRPGKGVFGGAAEGESAILSDVLSALVNLGYPPRNAEKALQDARRAAAPGRSRGERPAVSFEGLLRDALRSLSAGR